MNEVKPRLIMSPLLIDEKAFFVAEIIFIVPPKSWAYIKPLDLEQKNETDCFIYIQPKTIEQFIQVLPFLPDIILDYLGVSNISKDDNPGVWEVYEMYKHRFKKTHIELSNYINNLKSRKSANDPYQYSSILLLNDLELLQQVCKKNNLVNIYISSKRKHINPHLCNPSILNYSSSVHEYGINSLWFSSQITESIKTFTEAGFTSKPPSLESFGKRCTEIIDYSRKTIDQIENCDANNSTNKHDENIHFFSNLGVQELAKTISFDDTDFYEEHYEPFLQTAKKIARKMKDSTGWGKPYIENGNVRWKRQGRTNSKPHENRIDYESMTTEELKKHKSRDASEEKLKRCFHAIVNHNQKVSPDTTQMWLINNRALRNLSGCSPKVVADWMLKSQKAIDEENQKFALPCYQNRGRDITQAVNW